MNKIPYINPNSIAQTEAEREIAALIYDSFGQDEESCAQLGRDILYHVLRRFRPDLFADDPARGKLILQVGDDGDRYYFVSKDALRQSLDVPRAERRAWLFRDGRLAPAAIHSDTDVDVVYAGDWQDYEEMVADLTEDDQATER